MVSRRFRPQAPSISSHRLAIPHCWSSPRSLV
ncbi:hypothetical protein L914_13356 [Phytophthora nicotianae]|uniref:Uncharacterized protein n=1 Tax=Phytophthora nicotianae TaxID=4792 RepID=W2MYU1_PHYNI|nr:hypothetical protein L914_13356 [Phytophthora nicotianae]